MNGGRRERVGTFRDAAYMQVMEATDSTPSTPFDELFRQHIDIIRSRARQAAAGTSLDPHDIESHVTEQMLHRHTAGVEVTAAVVHRLVRQAVSEVRPDGPRTDREGGVLVARAVADLETRGISEPPDEQVRAAVAAGGESVSLDLVRAVRLRPVSLDGLPSTDALRELHTYDEYPGDDDDAPRAFVYDVERVHADIARLVGGDREGIDLGAPELLMELLTLKTSREDASHAAPARAEHPRHNVRMFSNRDIAGLLGLTERQVESRVASLRAQLRRFHTARREEGQLRAAA